MKLLFSTITIVATMLISSAFAQDLRTGSRVTVNSDWHDQNGGPYSPKIVKCNSNSGMCLRDTSTSPANKPLTKTKHGMQVTFPGFGITYLFKSGGKGNFYDKNGKKVGAFTWAQ